MSGSQLPRCIAVSLGAGKGHGALIVMEMKPCFSPELRPLLSPPPIPRDLLREQQPAADLHAAPSAVTGPRWQRRLGDTDTIPLGHGRDLQTQSLNGIQRGARAPQPTFAPEGALCQFLLQGWVPTSPHGEWLIRLVCKSPVVDSKGKGQC